MIERRGDFAFCAYIDASFAMHDDFRSRTGLVLQMCTAVVVAWSGKKDLNTKLSTESDDMIG